MSPLQPEIAWLKARWSAERPEHLGPLCVETPTLGLLQMRFGLTAFELALVTLCAGAELDPELARWIAEANGDPQLWQPTVGLALARLPDAHWSAVGPAGALRRWKLLELDGDGTLGLSRRPVRLAERLLHHLLGVSYVDEALAGRLRPLSPAQEPLTELDAATTRALTELIEGGEVVPTVGGLPLRSARHLAAAALRGARCTPFRLRASDLPPRSDDVEALWRTWEREAALLGAGLVLEIDDTPGARRAAGEWLDRALSPVVVVGAPPEGDDRRVRAVQAQRPDIDTQRSLWQMALQPSALAEPAASALAARFDLDAEGIYAATAGGLPAADNADGLAAAMGARVRERLRPRLPLGVRLIEPQARWSDLVLPAPLTLQLRRVASQARRRREVMERWGFGGRSGRGQGITALLAGPSGTGKTLAAEVLASALELDLFHVDLSAVVSKYIGETEKQLASIFDAAEGGCAVLLFDEADALFGKRTQVRDSHDRYANQEVSYLLQRMEAFQGLALLTTNMERGLDTAFLRRLRFVLRFPFPDLSLREALWRVTLPEALPTAGLRFDRLATLAVAGGDIRNIALTGAFLAAELGEPLSMPHLLAAARVECEKLGRPVSSEELRGWEEAS